MRAVTYGGSGRLSAPTLWVALVPAAIAMFVTGRVDERIVPIFRQAP